MGVLADRLAEMTTRHLASTEALYRDLDELKADFTKLQRETDQLIEDLGPCEER